MAKKRVHELTKQYDLPLPEVLKRLNAYGLKVKAAASAVDEEDAERALTGKPPREPEANGKPRQQRRAPQQTGMGFDRPVSPDARQRLAERAQELARKQQQQEKQRKKKEQQQRQPQQQ